MLEYIILGFLMERPASGYDLKQYMSETTSYFFDASYGSIYPALKRLEDKGCIHSAGQINGGKFKKLYSITEQGRECFLKWLKQPVRFAETRLDYLVPFFFYDYLDPETADKNLAQFMEDVQTGLNALRLQKQRLDDTCPKASQSFRYSVLEYGIRYYETVTGWCLELASQKTLSPIERRTLL